MPESLEERWAPENKFRELQVAIDHSNLRRAGDLSMAEKLKLGADLYDDGIRWLKQILKAEQPALTISNLTRNSIVGWPLRGELRKPDFFEFAMRMS